jgi:predicted ATPase
MPRLIVKNFGPIKDLDLEVKDYMVFVGPQASGKSTISKLIYFFEKLWDELSFPEDLIKRNFLERSLKLTDSLGHEEYFLDEIEIDVSVILESRIFGNDLEEYKVEYWYSEEHKVKLEGIVDDSGNYPLITANDKLYELYRKQESFLSNLYLRVSEHNWNVSNLRILFEVEDAPMSNIFEEIKFIPTGRSITTLLSNQLQNVELSQIDYLTGLFIQNITNIRTWFKKGFKELIDKIGGFLDKELLVETINNIMKGDYIFEFQNERIRVNNETDVSINFSSSGQQEALSVILTCLYYMWKGNGTQLHIEEPEAHLYPSSQKSIIDLLSLFFNYGRNRVVITTHSPYILASINNLLYAHKIGSKQEEAAHKIIDKNLWIDPTRLGAYKVTAEGTVENIIDEDLGIIQNESIDEIAQLINQQFDALFDLESEEE